MLHNMPGKKKCESEDSPIKPYNTSDLTSQRDIIYCRTSVAAVSCDMPENMMKCLQLYIPAIIRIPPLGGLLRPVCSHPDMQMVVPTEGVVVHAPNMDAATVGSLREFGLQTVSGDKIPGLSYPRDILYNAAIIGKRAFLNVDHTDIRVLEWLKKSDVIISHVNQGYAKCSTLFVNQDALVTADCGIYNAARAQNMDALLIPPQRKIIIEGFDYGFIGGAAGFVSETEIAFAGAFEELDDADIIGKFLGKYGVKPVSLGAGNVLDLGSLIPLCSV